MCIISHQDDTFVHYYTFYKRQIQDFWFVIDADEELKLLKHVATKGYRIRPPNVISLMGNDQTQPTPSPSKKTIQRKKQCLCCQLLVQDKHLRNYCIFEYSMIRPTSVSQKIYSCQTLGLPFHCLKFPLVLGKKRSRDA